MATQYRSLKTEKAALLLEIPRLQEEIEGIEQAKTQYRQKRRMSLRASFTGKKIDTLITRGGKEYKGVLVRGVDDVGISISHEAGIIRVMASELPDEIVEALDYDLEEVQQAKKKELLEVAQRNSQLRKAYQNKKRRKGDEPELPTINNEQIMSQIEVFMRKKAKAEIEASNARAQAQSSRSRSGPDGLETWEERVARFRKLARDYDDKISELRALLRH